MNDKYQVIGVKEHLNTVPTISNTPSPRQNLTFNKLKIFFSSRGIYLNDETFEENLNLKISDGRYNFLAFLLADNNNIPVRVAIFSGKKKSDKLFSVKEYGNTCILYSLEKMFDLADSINILQADETNRVLDRKDVPFFNFEAFREAVINAFEHNCWLSNHAPQITIFTDRIEIVSHGGIPSDLSITDFYKGISKPVNLDLANLFLQLRISEKTGKGVAKIVEVYGKNAFEFSPNTIIVTIPFNKIRVNEYSIQNQLYSQNINLNLSYNQKRIIAQLQNNPNITTSQLVAYLSLSESTINKSINYLKKHGVIERVGSKKSGYWKVVEMF